jgi:hypothetical protein
MAAFASASQNATTSRRRSVHQRSLPSWLPQAWVRSTGQRRLARIGAGTPAWRSAEHAACSQRLPAGLVVVGGVQVHHRLGGQPPDHGAGACKGI